MIQSSAHANGSSPLTQAKGLRAKKPQSGLSSLFSSLLASAKSPKGGESGKMASDTAKKAALSPSRLREKPAAPRIEKNVVAPKLQGKNAPQLSVVPGKNAEHSVPVPARKAALAGNEEASPVREARSDQDRRTRRNRASGDEPLSDSLAAVQALDVRSQGLKKSAVAEASPKEEGVRAVDGKKNDKRKDRLDIEVYDLRTKPDARGSDAVHAGKVNEADMVLSLSSDTHSPENADSKVLSRSPDGKMSFSEMISRELRDGYNADIVKQASIVLKNGGDGLIRLSLKPESLGSVKIHLELADNIVSGKIIVESNEALRAFEREMASLEQAFKDGGFDGASIELSVSSNGADGGSRQQFAGNEAKPFYSQRLASDRYDGALTSTATDGTDRYVENASVNLLA